MSSFSDFDEFLRDQESSKKQSEKEKSEKLNATRAHFDPFVSDIFRLFKEYYDTIILPRRKFHMIFKKKETLKAASRDEPQFLYRINLVPVEILPLAFDPGSHPFKDHLAFHYITKNDWHFDVSLQLNLAFFESDTALLEPRITLCVWGNPKQKEHEILPIMVTQENLTAWTLPYTRFTLNGPADEIKTLFEKILILITPQVFAHLEEVWKIKK
jgi:hypothetical protein